MSRNNGKVSKLQELRLSLSRSRGGGGPSMTPGGGSPRRLSSSSSSIASPPSSCVSSEGSPEAGVVVGAPSMILAGCPRCMMYVMLSREDPRCPKCHSTVLLDFNDAADPRHAGAGGKSKGRRG
ncbi:protein GL2-INTERACTING REPRESSOR 1-like [Phragmites australis]|uniref:protein GL2-INTERACTING REPRESSOR 1-like n=1 Tax=Phragmites australis TaxID=29695 RepID=UPI002D785CB7|nr:protein GL2-INTERACTING REPRESSOR 1-like [Phragmites australis]